jgi:serine/threonine-protein kinase ATR
MDIRKELCINPAASFTNPQLFIDSTSVVKTFQILNTSTDEPPAKRRKTLPEFSEDTSTSIYEQLVVFMNGSIHESPVLNLANLHNTIQ